MCSQNSNKCTTHTILEAQRSFLLLALKRQNKTSRVPQILCSQNPLLSKLCINGACFMWVKCTFLTYPVNHDIQEAEIRNKGYFLQFCRTMILLFHSKLQPCNKLLMFKTYGFLSPLFMASRSGPK